ncbi:MAG: putative acetyltransferase [Sporichthyaceae bacterium]
MSPRYVVKYAMTLSVEDVGSRVSVRRNHPDGGLGDVVGDLLGWENDVLEIRRKDGSLVRVATGDLVAGKVVPPAPLRRSRPERL